MGRRHSGAIETFAVRRAMTAKSITPTVDARYFGMRIATKSKQQCGQENQSKNKMKCMKACLILLQQRILQDWGTGQHQI
jgi:hypothetical protein